MGPHVCRSKQPHAFAFGCAIHRLSAGQPAACELIAMLAWLQRLWVLSALAVSALLAALIIRGGHSWWLAAASGLAILNAHAFVLAFEFALLHRMNPGPGVPKPSQLSLLRAWWGEVFTGLRVFGWRQPFRASAVGDSLAGASGRRGVLLVHGFICNRGLWNPWMIRLRSLGTPYVAVTLEPVFGSIDDYVTTLETAIGRLEAASGCAPVVVAHSMGGLAVRAWMREQNRAERIHSVVTIGTPHAGTWLARFALTTNGRQMRQGNGWLQRLQAEENDARRSLFTCYFGNCDNIVFPAANAALPGATNHHVPDVAHVDLAFHEPIFDDVCRRTRP